ncbi:toll/interleukin-1 receptor domain-containing protein [Streptomyces sp. NBC_01525]|uniref:toll/interleukin-1 receptor domain-containing protein n=1 Tax=Streptomyces sp. NBC_01525 TaxID=2903893 RepID=UPI0038703945
MPDVFINYRTGDEEATATLLERELSRRFGTERIFRASKSIGAGQNFPQALLTAVRRCHVLLAVIGPRWADARTGDGRRALGDPGDWTRRELLEATGSATRIIPVLVGPTARLRRAELPEALAGLADLQYRRLNHRNADADLRRIADDLAALVPSLAAVDRLRAGERTRHPAVMTSGPCAAPLLPTGPALPTERPLRERRLEGIRLDSARPDYPFLFSATVRWRPTRGEAEPAHPGLADLAVSTVVSRAQVVVGQEAPERWEAVRLRLRGELGCRYTDPSARVTVLAEDIGLTLNEDDRARLAQLSRLRKEEDAWERHRHFERNRRAYLGDEVLKTPGSAVVWWLARHGERVEDAVRMIGPLAQLSAAANDTEIPEAFRHPGAECPARAPFPAAACARDVPYGTAAPGHGAPAPEPQGPPSGRTGTRPFPGGTQVDGTFGTPAPSTRQGPTPTDPDDEAAEHVVRLLDELGLAEGSPERAAYVERLARSTDEVGRSAAAARIRQRFATRRWASPEAEASPVPGHPEGPVSPPASEGGAFGAG